MLYKENGMNNNTIGKEKISVNINLDPPTPSHSIFKL